MVGMERMRVVLRKASGGAAAAAAAAAGSFGICCKSGRVRFVSVRLRRNVGSVGGRM